MQIQAVVFDIGNVLIGWQPQLYFNARIGSERTRTLFQSVDMHFLNDRVDRGGDFFSVVDDAAIRYPEFAEELAIWRANWLDMTGPVLEHSVRLQRALRANGVPVFALSNFGVDPFQWAEKKYPFLTEFDRRYISGHMKTAKPDEEIYRMVEDDCGIDPSALLFTDDRRENIDTAQSRGWKVHLFDGASGWAQCLVRHGLLEGRQVG